ncbi:MAG: beta-ketoacyl-ACP synthase III [Planctomycetota bacterium]|jgi:3-oxoacyl-[acyl-carrier-protein] synthase-3
MNPPGAHGVRIAGVGSAVPAKVLTNADLEKMVDTSDEWIVQRTGIRERRAVDPEHEGTFTLSRDALQRALDHAGMKAGDLDQIIIGTVTAEMTCPSVACRVSHALGAAPAGAFDLVAACSGFVYSINVADSLVRAGRNKAVGVVGCDTMTTASDFTERSVSILFGDAAGAAILVRDDDPSMGCIYQSSQADGSMWESLYIPRLPRDVPEHDVDNPIRLGCLRMNGREIYKFAVAKFREVIVDALEVTGLTVDDISQFVCHQSNVRIIDAAKHRLDLPPEKVYINIDRYGNSSAGSVGLCFDELWRAGKIKPGDYVLMVAFGGGLTWATSIWKI